MHELSIVMSIVQLAEQETARAGAVAVDEVELDIGMLAGIESSALEFAWDTAVKNTCLQHAARKINHIPGRARCMDCDAEFNIHQYFDACPHCQGHLLSILQGKELKLRSLVVS